MCIRTISLCAIERIEISNWHVSQDCHRFSKLHHLRRYCCHEKLILFRMRMNGGAKKLLAMKMKSELVTMTCEKHQDERTRQTANTIDACLSTWTRCTKTVNWPNWHSQSVTHRFFFSFVILFYFCLGANSKWQSVVCACDQSINCVCLRIAINLLINWNSRLVAIQLSHFD